MTMTQGEAHRVADATATIGTDHYHVDIQAGQHRLAADERADHGGADTGPPPFGLLLSGLGACTAITLRMYADRRDWPLEGVDVQLVYTIKDRATRWIDRTITLRGPLEDGQRARLAEVAEKTPVTKAVRAGTEIRTTVARA
jgi:putative redox protein